MNRIAKKPNIEDYDIPKEFHDAVNAYAEAYRLNSEPGFFGGLMKRLDLLHAGKVLIMEHEIYGTYKFRMNPQRNMIYVEALDERAVAHEEECKKVSKNGEVFTTNKSIQYVPDTFIFNGYGEWSVETESGKFVTTTTYVPGKIERI